MGVLDFTAKLPKLGNQNFLKNNFTKNNSTKPSSNPGTGVLSKFIFMDFCTPAKFYLIVALLTLIYYVSTEQSFVWIIVKAVLFIIWGFTVNNFCTSGYKSIAWLMAIVPQSIFLLVTMRVTPALPPIPVTAGPSKV